MFASRAASSREVMLSTSAARRLLHTTGEMN